MASILASMAFKNIAPSSSSESSDGGRQSDASIDTSVQHWNSLLSRKSSSSTSSFENISPSSDGTPRVNNNNSRFNTNLASFTFRSPVPPKSRTAPIGEIKDSESIRSSAPAASGSRRLSFDDSTSSPSPVNARRRSRIDSPLLHTHNDANEISDYLSDKRNRFHVDTHQKILEEGEHVKMKIEPVSVFEETDSSLKTTSGVLLISNYRMLFQGKLCSSVAEVVSVSIPLTSIHSVKKEQTQIASRHCILRVKTKQFRFVQFIFQSDQDTACDFVFSLLMKVTQHEKLDGVFAFHYKMKERQLMDSDLLVDFNTWRCYNPYQEFHRLGVTDDPQWKALDNSDYSFCATYPSVFWVPSKMSMEQLKEVANFRSKERIPAICWVSKTGSVLSRSSQPMVGLKGTKCDADQRLISLLHPDSEWMYIIDPRPKVNAIGNQVSGEGGYERYYPDCKLQFMDIGNIHTMSESWNRLFKLLRNSCMQGPHDSGWLQGLESTVWLKHIQLLLIAAVEMVDILERKKSSVLVHCSDGWDRTSQLVSLCELMLDPYYRTIRGFIVLIEKEWHSFGHQFALRTFGYSKAGVVKKQMSPIFMQFIDCVMQLKYQFPLSFEFNTAFLMFILDSVYDCKFGTFLYNCEKERMNHVLRLRTESLWNYILERENEYVDICYRENLKTLHPSLSGKKIVFHEDLYLRWDSAMKKKESTDAIVKLLIARNEELEMKLKSTSFQKRELSRAHSLSLMKMQQLAAVKVPRAQTEAKKIVDLLLEKTFVAISEKVMRPNTPVLNRSASFRFPKWMPNDSTSECNRCRTQFSFFVRRHHCRYCGEIFCGECSAGRRPIPQFNFFDPVRVCKKCDAILKNENAGAILTSGSKTFEICQSLLESTPPKPSYMEHAKPSSNRDLKEWEAI